MSFQIIIDKISVTVNPNMSILQACEAANIIVPRFCYHKRLAVAGNCRMCLVEIEKAPKLVVSCAMPVMPKMVIFTQSLAVKKAREGILEFLLVNHPLDCPICDQGGECDLQDQTMIYGSDRGRFREYKRATEDKQCGPLIKTIMTRCIHCTRCVRFANEIIGHSDLGTSGRGNSIEISMYIKKLVKSELSGNIIDLCPVGALTSKPYTFLARPWELKSIESIDTFDAIGSNIRIDIRGYEIMRILPRLNEKINEEWISDKTRFAFDGLKRQRLYDPLLKENGSFKKITWQHAFEKIVEVLSNTQMNNKIAGVIGNQADIESMALLKYLIAKQGGIFTEYENTSLKGVDFQENYRFNSTMAKLNQCDTCIIVGVNPRIEGSILNLKLRKRYLTGKFKIACFGTPINLTFPVNNFGATFSNLLKFVEGQHQFCSQFVQAKKPIMILGKLFFQQLGEKKCQLLLECLIKNTNLIKLNWNGINILNSGASDCGKFELGITTSNVKPSNLNFLYVIGEGFFKRSSKDTFIVYQGHHGNNNILQANLVLPGSVFTEKVATYVNTEGSYQNTNIALLPPFNAKEDWKVLYGLIEKLKYGFQKEATLFLYKRLSLLNPIISKPNENNLFVKNKIFGSNSVSLFKNTFLLSAKSENFYMTDSISKASPTMAKCSKVLLNKQPFLN